MALLSVPIYLYTVVNTVFSLVYIGASMQAPKVPSRQWSLYEMLADHSTLGNVLNTARKHGPVAILRAVHVVHRHSVWDHHKPVRIPAPVDDPE